MSLSFRSSSWHAFSRLHAAAKPSQPRARRVFTSLVAIAASLAASLLGNQAYAQTTSASTNTEVIVTDFNHDGIPDVLVPSPTGSTATIVFGTVPYGTFSPNSKAVTLPSSCISNANGGVAVGNLLAADFNSDGFPDLYFTCQTSTSGANYTAVMLGNGDGTFAPPIALNAPYAQGGVSGDFNQDGKTDLVVISYPSGIYFTNNQNAVLLFFAGKGDGTFAAPVSSLLGSSATFQPGNFIFDSPIATDVDGDGYPDIVFNSAYGYNATSNNGATLTISVFGNKKDGTFGVASQSTHLPDVIAAVGTFPASQDGKIVAGHFTSSAVPGFVVSDSGTSPGLFFIANTSTPNNFSLATAVKTAYPGIQTAAAATFANSGLTDLAVSTGSVIAALVSDGTGHFAPTYASLTLPATSTLFATADANGDGYSDIYTASASGTGVSLAVNLVSGSATATSQPFTLPAGTTALTATWPGNLNYTGTTLSGSQTVAGTPTAVLLASSLNPAPVGSPVTFTAVAAPTSPANQTITGSVIFTDGNTVLATVPLDDTGTATFTTANLVAATHTIAAAYSGDSFFAASTGSLSQGITAPGQLTANLLLNPGAELGSIQFWTATGPGSPTVDSGTFDSGINPHTGTYDFVGFNDASDSLSQTVSLLTQGITPAMLDTGTLRAALSFYEQGLNQGTPSDDASVTLTFLDASGATLSSVNSGEVDSHNNTWQNFSNSYAIPSGARSITYTMNFIRHAGSDLDGFVDDNSLLILAAAPVAGVPTLTWTPPGAILFGTPLSSTQLDAVATSSTGAAIPGTYTYTPAAGAILPAGPQTLSVLFTPTDLTAFTTATTTVPLTILPAATTATLAITSGTSAGTTVAQGTAITLTATVLSGATPITPGQVNFCDASATTCTDIHLLGTAQLTSAGTATIKLIPSIGTHTYKAVFLGTASYTAVSSAGVPLTVTGQLASATTVNRSGNPGSYSLTANTAGTGSPTSSPTGSITFLDITNANVSVGTATLGRPTFTETFPNQTAVSNLTGNKIILTADLNNDGIADIITGTYSNPSSSSDLTQTFSVFLGKGDGTFILRSSIPSQGTQVVAGDFNHDGTLDLAISNYATTSLFTLLGNGDGTFTLASTSTIPLAAGTPLVADFDRDGILDLAFGADTTNNAVTTGTLTLLLGVGDGNFTSGATTSTPSAASGSVTGDFNGDGIPDILASGFYNQSATVLLGNGDGTFMRKSTISGLGIGSLAATADFNSDGATDLAIVDYFSNTVSTFLGKGDGSFTLRATIQNPQASADSSDAMNIGLADFNRDGIPDIAVTADDGIYIYTGAGDGTFTITAQAVPQTVASSATGEDSGLLIADFNNDGLPDVATGAFLLSDRATHTVLALNTFTSTASATAANISPVGTGTHQIVASFPGDTTYAASTSTPVALIAQQLPATLSWNPSPSTIAYGTPLGPQQLNAIATTLTGTALPGTYTYTPVAGTILAVGTQTLRVAFTPTNTNYAPAATTQAITVTQAAPAITWPTPAAIPYGTPLTSTQLNATANTPGTFTYAPAIGALLPAGTQTLSVTFTPTDTLDYTTATITRNLIVAQAKPTLAWPTPAPVLAGTTLSATQLNATATGISGATLAGTFTYTPAAGTVPAVGTQTLSVTFAPTDTLNYTAATATVQLQVNTFTLTAITPNTAKVADPDKLITLTGTGFTTASLAQVNGSRIATTFVNATTLTATVPAANFITVGTLQIAVLNPTTSAVTASLPLTVTAPTPSVTLSGPTTTSPGTQPALAFAIANPYPIPLTATFALNFASSVTPAVDDPSIQFANGGRTFTFTVPANSTTTPAIQLQAGTVAGTITIPLTLTAAGVNVTPTTVQPVVIVVPGTVPAVSTATLTRSGAQLTVTIHGFSNTREVATAAFHFMPATGAVIDTPDVSVPVTPIFAGWFTSAPSTQYGSSFTYTQIFTVSDTTANIGSVQVTLTNSVGVSTSYTAQ